MKGTKESAIISAYGKHWDSIDPAAQRGIIKNNGFMYFTRYEESKTPSQMFGEENIEKTFDFSSELAGHRPISLNGLEDNNGWDFIDDENTASVKDGIYYDLYDAENDDIIWGVEGVFFVLSLIGMPCITHIRISNNKKPLYK
jgi:hypothetical protein